MAYDREAAVRLVLVAVKPHIDLERDPNDPKSIDETIEQVMRTMHDEPVFGIAFDAMVKAIWDTAQYYAREEAR